MKTYKEIAIKYYDNSGNEHVRCVVPVSSDALVHYELMQSHYCKLSFKLAKPVYLQLGDFIETPYGRFELIDMNKAKDGDTMGYSYDVQFDAYYRKFKNKILKYRPSSGSQESTFSLTSTIGTHAEVVLKNLEYYASLSKSFLYDQKYVGEGTDYVYKIDASVDSEAAKVVTYSSSSILDAISSIAQAFDCEWWFEGNILHFGTCENTNAITDFRLDSNIVSMSSSQSQATYANRIYAFGAARNLPSGYKSDSDADITKDGVVEKRLMLPTSNQCSSYNKNLLEDNGFELKDGCIQVKGLAEDQYVEGVTTNDDIYPRNLIKTGNVTSYEKDVEDESAQDGSTYIKRTFYRVNSLSIVDNDGGGTGDMAFRSSYKLSGKTLHIVFQSGSLNGMDFECEFNPDGKSEILRDKDGKPILKDGNEQINPDSQVFEIIANEDYGRFLPDTDLYPKAGDTFVLYNWDSTKLGNTLVSSASNELLTDSIKKLKKSQIDPSTYTCTADPNYSFDEGKGKFHGVGDRVNLYNKGYDETYRASRIIGYELHLDLPFDGIKYYVGEKPSYSRLNAMESKIEELIYNGQSYVNGGGGKGSSVYIIKSYDSTTPTDYNVYSAKKVEDSFLHKDKEDKALSLISFMRGLLVGYFSTLSGGSWTPDTEGRSHLITDYLEVRMKAIFEELVIKKTSTIGGKEIISPAGGVAAYKVDEVTVTYKEVSQKAYRCYFLAEQDGDKVDNDFAMEDQVRSESFNLNAGKYHKTGNHFLWRLVIGRDEEPVALEGKKYHYIDLSETDCATGSDVPMKGDVLSQCGNRSDPMRQSCLVFSAVDTYAPCLALYYGINSYSFDNKEYVEYGVDKSGDKPKAFFRSYGDAYIGDRPTKDNNYEGDSYVKYDSEQKKVIIKAELSVKSTLQGNTLEETFKDIQKQFDRKAETWYQAEDPSIAWETDLEKSEHKGDLWYNTTNGETSYWNGSSWQKQDIPDAVFDMIDGKSSIYVSKPSSYEECDLWILEAAYTLGGVAYTKGELVTAIRSNTTFNAADWTKKVIYTDDTEAKKAQASIKETQTNLTNLGNTVKSNRDAFDKFTEDGYLDSSEIAAIAQDSKRLEDAFAAAEKSYNEVANSDVLSGTSQLTDLKAAFGTDTTGLLGAKKELIAYIADIVTRYNAADSDGKKNINSRVATLYDNFQAAYDTFYNKLGLASAYITSTIIGKLNAVIGDVATYNYLKEALSENASTDINGGLILSSLIALRDPKTGYVQSGINGIVDNTAKGNGIATWWGGYMNDGQVVGFDDKGDVTKNAATSLIRFDGSGYLANGAIYWGVDGKVHADPTSFIISEKNLGAYLAFFEPTWKSGSDGSSIKDLVALTPQAPFKTLTVSNDLSVEGKLKIGSITLSVVNGALKIDGNVYSTGGMSAYGDGTNNGGGGGLVASVKSYTDIIKGTYTDNDLASIPNAYAIKALSSRIDNIATELGGLSLSWNNITGKPSTFAPSAHTHKWTEITDRITKVSQLTNDAGYLTAHQSLASYYTKAEIDAKGYTTNKGTVTSVALTLPTGLTCATKTITTSGTFAISLASGYSIPTTAKQTAWDGAVSAKHTHSNKSVLDGISSTKVSHWNSAYDWYALMTTDEETADGIINKWNEVVSFLANIAQTDTLSGIVDGINKSISDEVARAKKAEGVNASGISANKGSIATLQGYFTNGSAKKAIQLTNARKLWGNSFNGTADINGNIIVPSGKYISIGNIKMEYDATNKALKITNTTTNEVANLYTSGGVSAYGVGISSSSGGGLNGSVKSYADALKLASESLSEIASAYSIKQLSTRITSLEGGSATSISVSGGGNAVTSVTKNGTTISVVKGSTFSLSGHTHKWADITDRPSSLKNPSALSWSGYSSGSYDGSAAKSISIPNNTNQLTNGAGFITASASITGNAATATKVNHSLSVFGKSFNGSADVMIADTNLITSISTATANLTDKTEILTSYASDNGFNDSNSKNRIYRRPASAIWGYINSKTISNADKLDNVHLNGIFTALSNTNNGVSMTIGTVAKSLANMQVYSATKLVTARNIALNGDLTGNANFDGSANITINGYMSYCNATASNTNTYPWRRIAKVNEITGNYSDGCILLYISEGFNGGYYGIARVYIRTDNLSTGANASCSIQWISRNGYGLDSLKIAMYKTTGKAYYDVFLKMRGAYASVVIRTLQDQRGGLGKRFTLVNSTETTNAASHTEAYATIEDAATAIHNQAYTSIAQGSDVATVHNADMVDGIHASGLFTNLSNSGNSLSITVGGTNKTLTVNYASNAGNADTLDGVHASGLFTNLSNSGNNISITIGGTNKTLTAAYATNCDTVDGYHAQSGSSKPYGKIPVIGTDGVIELGHYIDFHHDNTTGSDYSVRLQTNGNHGNVVTLPTATGTLALTSDNVASATKLQTARTIWGQSFNGTANVSGALSGATTISASNTISTTLQNGALKIGNKLTPISAIDEQVIFNTGAAIRFGEKNWNLDEWAGLKYTHSNKTVYLGIADGSVFNANNAQRYGKLQLKAIDRILFDSDSDSFQIHYDNSNDCLRIGSSDNSGYVLVSDIGNWDTDGADEKVANNWLISTDGSGSFKRIYCPSIYTANSIPSTPDKALLLSGNVIREYHRGGSPYYSSIIFNDTTLALSAYGNIGLTSTQGITIDGGSGTISMVASGGFDVTYRAASLSVSQTGASEYTWTFNHGSIKTTGGITAYQSSDERLKHNIHGVDSLAIIKAMGGTVAFRYNEDDKASIGWIAQRVLHNTLMQDLVEKDEDGYLKINYWSPKLIAVAFGAIEQVGDEVSRLKARVVFLESEVQRLSGKQGSSDKKRLDNKNINLLN
nr:MAG TPA: tail protein [Caudoviricetes sp.]